jgi:type VI secretion system secreted protein VgrG
MPRVMEIVTPLDDDVLLFHRMSGREEVSRLFEYELDLLSMHGDINMDDVLGKNVTVKVALPDETIRYFNGYVTRFAQNGTVGRYYRYVAMVRPWLWFLTRTADCRIFQDMTVPEIVKAVFGDHKTADFKLELTGSYRKWTYCVQYRETDFNFISRLLEHEGIYYYVRHTEGHDTVVLTDSTSKHTPFPGYELVPFIAPGQVSRPELERISRWDFGREIQPGVYVHDDYDLERPKVELKTRKALPRNYTPSDYEIYDYPGHYLKEADGEQYAGVRIDEYASQFETAQAWTNAKGIVVGSLFTLDAYPRGDQNREHLIVAANYELQFSNYEAMPEGLDTSYECSFTAMSSQQQFRPRRLTPKPFVQGPQTAVVVGPAGDEIYTDDFARVKVQFHWDRYGKRDENSSCWIRVAQTWAGKGWGSVSTPRIGHEVIVDFLEGDPDQPIIIGAVHNAENNPPHKGVVSGLKSNTHKGRGSNEMTMDDTAGKEKITIHGQYDMGTTVEHDQTNTVNNDFTETIKKNATISITEGNLVHDVVAGTAKYHVLGSVTEIYDDKHATIVQNDVAIICSAGPIAIASDAEHIFIKGTTSIQLKVGESMIWMDSGGQIGIEGVDISIKASGSLTMKGAIVVSEAGGQHTTKGALVLSEAGGTNTIKGSMVMLN